jgi:hypothetical protein
LTGDAGNKRHFGCNCIHILQNNTQKYKYLRVSLIGVVHKGEIRKPRRVAVATLKLSLVFY